MYISANINTEGMELSCVIITYNEEKNINPLLDRLINALEENVQLTNCTFEGAGADDCPRIDDCCIRSPFWVLQNRINQMFDQLTLQELIN